RKLRPGKTRPEPRQPDTNWTRGDRRSIGWNPPDAAMGDEGESLSESSRARLRRSDGALLPPWCAAVDVCADIVSHTTDARILGYPTRAHGVAYHLPEPKPTPSRYHPAMARGLHWAMGGRYVGGRDDQSQWQD